MVPVPADETPESACGTPSPVEDPTGFAVPSVGTADCAGRICSEIVFRRGCNVYTDQAASLFTHVIAGFLSNMNRETLAAPHDFGLKARRAFSAKYPRDRFR